MRNTPYKLQPIGRTTGEELSIPNNRIEVIKSNTITIGDVKFRVEGDITSKPPATGTSMFVWKEGGQILALPTFTVKANTKAAITAQHEFDQLVEERLSETINRIDAELAEQQPLKKYA